MLLGLGLGLKAKIFGLGLATQGLSLVLVLYDLGLESGGPVNITGCRAYRIFYP